VFPREDEVLLSFVEQGVNGESPIVARGLGRRECSLRAERRAT